MCCSFTNLLRFVLPENFKSKEHGNMDSNDMCGLWVKGWAQTTKKFEILSI